MIGAAKKGENKILFNIDSDDDEPPIDLRKS